MGTLGSMPASAPRSRSESLLLALLLLAIGALAASVTMFDLAPLYLTVFVLLACWLVPALLSWYRGTVDWFEPIHALGMLYFVYFGLGAVWTVGDPSKVAYDRYIVPYIPSAALLCTVGYACLLAGYFALWPGRQGHRTHEGYPRGTLFVLLPAGLGFAGFLSQTLVARAQKLGLSVGLFSSLAQLAPLFVFAWGLAWLLFLSGRASRAQRWLLFAVLVPATPVIVVNSLERKSMVIALLALPLLALWYARRHVPWITLCTLLLVVVFVIFPFNNTFRALDTRLSTGERLSLTSSIIGKWNTQHYLERSVGTFKARMALINSVAVVLRDVPRWVPFAGGRTIFVPIAVNSVPRVLWPDKPKMTFGREFGETFRVVHILDLETNIAATIPGELYWNFALPGVLLGMALWGWLLRLAYRRYGEGVELDPVRRAIYLVLLVQFLHFESGITGPLVSVVRTLLVLEAYRLVSLRLKLVDVRPVRAG